MRNFLTSILIGLCLFLSNISGQAKSYKLVSHIALEHSAQTASHSHDHDHHHEHKKSSGPLEHSHHCEMSLLTVLMAIPAKQDVSLQQIISFNGQKSFYLKNELSLLSFSPHIFRPPIA